MAFHFLAVKPIKILLIVLALVVLVALALIIISASWGPVFEAEDIIHRDGNTLVVLVHGYNRGRDSLRDVQKVISEEFPTADLMVPTFRSGLFSNARPEDIASELEDSIDKAFKSGKTYQKIVLVGHSIGALLVRKAFVFGCGHTEDRAGYSPRSDKHAWTERVERIVLLAGMNRGWSISTAPTKMGPVTRFVFWLGKSVGRLTGTGLFVRGCERGAPFIANLRLQWLDVTREQLESGRPLAVIQLLGVEDDVVSSADSKDVAVSQDFIFIKIGQTDHGSIIDFRDRYNGKRREEALRETLTTPIDVLRSDNKETPLTTDPSVERAIFIMHGIRDQADWTEPLAEYIKNVYVSKYGGEAKKLATITSQYGYFPMLPFLFVSDRQKNVRWFVDLYTEIKAECPNLREIDFVGHSNGTFILASALRRYKTLRIDRVVFAGSVVPQNYEWDDLIKIQKRVNAVKNYVGSADWVVGIFPAMFQLVNEKVGIKSFGFDEIGSAGFNGFYSTTTRPFEQRFVKGGHGAVVDDEREFPSIAEFILKGGNEFDFANLGVKEKDRFVDWLSKLCLFVWLLVIAVVGVGLLLVPFGARKVSKWVGRLRKRAVNPRTLWWATKTMQIAYILVLIILLYTI
jgi:pimeloyl-ACP methyl ester carboxylesterase